MYLAYKPEQSYSGELNYAEATRVSRFHQKWFCDRIKARKQILFIYIDKSNHGFIATQFNPFYCNNNKFCIVFASQLAQLYGSYEFDFWLPWHTLLLSESNLSQLWVTRRMSTNLASGICWPRKHCPFFFYCAWLQ